MTDNKKAYDNDGSNSGFGPKSDDEDCHPSSNTTRPVVPYAAGGGYNDDKRVVVQPPARICHNRFREGDHESDLGNSSGAKPPILSQDTGEALNNDPNNNEPPFSDSHPSSHKMKDSRESSNLTKSSKLSTLNEPKNESDSSDRNTGSRKVTTTSSSSTSRNDKNEESESTPSTSNHEYNIEIDLSTQDLEDGTRTASDDREPASPEQEAKSSDIERGRSKQLKDPFPILLMRMLDKETEAESALVKWLSKGNGFEVMDQNGFEKEIIPKYFQGPCIFSSFVRKLYRWHFRQIEKHTTGYYVFVNEDLMRGTEPDIKKMKTKKGDKTGSAPSPNSDGNNVGKTWPNQLMPEEQLQSTSTQISNEPNLATTNNTAQEAMLNTMRMSNVFYPSVQYPYQHAATFQHFQPFVTAWQTAIANMQCNSFNFHASQQQLSSNKNTNPTLQCHNPHDLNMLQIQQQQALNTLWNQMLQNMDSSMQQGQTLHGSGGQTEAAFRVMLQTCLQQNQGAFGLYPAGNISTIPRQPQLQQQQQPLQMDPIAMMHIFQSSASSSQQTPQVQNSSTNPPQFSNVYHPVLQGEATQGNHFQPTIDIEQSERKDKKEDSTNCAKRTMGATSDESSIGDLKQEGGNKRKRSQSSGENEFD